MAAATARGGGVAACGGSEVASVVEAARGHGLMTSAVASYSGGGEVLSAASEAFAVIV